MPLPDFGPFAPRTSNRYGCSGALRLDIVMSLGLVSHLLFADDTVVFVMMIVNSLCV